MKIKGFENEDIQCSEFTEKVGNDIIDYKFEYENNKALLIALADEIDLFRKLLNEEKEKNKELEAINKMQEYRINVIDEREFVSKDKIREKIKEIKSNEQYNYVGTEWSESEVVGMLEDLLEV